MTYPGAEQRQIGNKYGRYRRSDLRPRVVLHTTETTSLPGYSGGNSAPHLTVFLDTGRVVQDVYLDNAAGSLRRESTETNHAHALQIEIVGYAADSQDWPDAHYARLQSILEWFRATYQLPWTYCPEGVDGSNGYGVNGSVRMSANDWYDRSGWGYCGHANVVDNSHWDPGRLDLRTLFGQILPPPTDPDPDPTERGTTMLPMFYTDGYNSPTPPGRTEKREDVRLAMIYAERVGWDPGNSGIDGLYGNRFAEFVRERLGHVDGKTLGAVEWTNLLALVAGENPGGGIAEHTHDGTTTGPVS